MLPIDKGLTKGHRLVRARERTIEEVGLRQRARRATIRGAEPITPLDLPLRCGSHARDSYRCKGVNAMSRFMHARRHMAVVACVLAAGLVAFSSAALAGAFAGTPSTAQTNSARQQFAQRLLKNQAVRLTWPAQLALRMQASGSNQ